jgi:putative ABC transport system ATP-binding protein
VSHLRSWVPEPAPAPAQSLEALSFRQVAKSYVGPPPFAALQPFDLTVASGEFVTISGPSGSGKSTLMNLAGLLDRPTAGEISIDGVATALLSEKRRSWIRGNRIGFVFQSYHLLARRTVLENVMLAGLYQGVPPNMRLAQSRAVLARVGLAGRADALASQLSGGERQRVAVARAVVHSPALVLCDEPTGNLDSAAATAVMELLGGLHREGMTVVLITHDPAVAAYGQRRVLIRDGQVTLGS